VQVLYGAEDPAVPVRYWCYDETRFGLKTIPRRLITLPGTQPLGPVQWQFKAFYLYGAVEPLSGEHFFLEFSHHDSDCFQIYLEHLAQRYPHTLHIIQLDNASSHSAKKLELPDNIVLMFQPPYSPELNPIERLWQHMKDQLSWVLFSTLDSLRQTVSEILQGLTPQTIRSLTGYPFILSALKHANI
jgi:transposase